MADTQKNFVEIERLEQSMTGAKAYVDKIGNTKVDKTVLGEGKTAVSDLTVTVAPNTGEGAIGSTMTIAGAAVSLADGTSTPISEAVDLADASGVKALKTEIGTQMGNKQDADDALTSISGLTGTGVMKMTGPDTVELGTIGDADLTAGDAIAFAKDAFAAKDGSVKTSKVTDPTGVSTVELGAGGVTITAPADAEGKPSIYVKDPTSGEARRVASEDEVKTMIDDAVSSASVYMGKFTYYMEAATLDDAKAAVAAVTAADGQTAIIFDTAAKVINTGVYTTEWTWTAATWDNSAWAWVEDILSSSSANPDKPSGRIIYDNVQKKFDVIEDREGKPDDFGLTYNSSGALSIKMTTDATNYGANPVSAALNAANIGYGDGMTIKEKITSLEYTVATQEEVQAMLDRVFGTTGA